MKDRKLQINYADLGSQGIHAIISANGTYVCTVEQCSEESTTSFKSRARHLKRCLDQYPGTLIDACGKEI